MFDEQTTHDDVHGHLPGPIPPAPPTDDLMERHTALGYAAALPGVSGPEDVLDAARAYLAFLKGDAK